jgi:hypothetical protein
MDKGLQSWALRVAVQRLARTKSRPPSIGPPPHQKNPRLRCGSLSGHSGRSRPL